jgi:hypothetical protein
MNIASAIAPSEGDIAALAHQLWLDRGCPVGSSQEDWFRAEAALMTALVAKYGELLRGPSIDCSNTHMDSEIVVEFLGEGHWEVWEREWSGAHWVSDLPPLARLECYCVSA